MKKWNIYFVVVLWVLVGCVEKPSHSSEVEIEVTENEQVVDASNNEDIGRQEPTHNEQFIYPTVVTLIDPQTLKIVQSFTPQLLGFDTDMELYKSNIKKIARKLARGTEGSNGYDQSMVLDKVGDNGEILKGSPGIILKESELVEQIMEASKNGDRVFLPLYVLESNYNVEEIASLNEVVVASFTTYFNPSELGRSKNIELSAMALNNIIVGEGDYFSFNTMVGERTEEKGYQPALEIINKKKVMGIGGGICQTSSTLFNAVDQLGVHMTERHHHSLNIGYVPTGRDATVSYGTLDFKFQNDRGAPFLIKAFYKKGMLTIEIRTSQQYVDKMAKLN